MRRERPATWGCGVDGGVGEGDSRAAAVAADPASASECGEHSADPPEKQLRLSGSGHATCRHSEG